MSREPLVSVVTIFLNEERFLQEAIDSVVAQTTDRWELLLIDDGSTDDSPTIARRSAERDPRRIRYITHADRRNLGKSISRNLGLQEASAELIAFLDADDVFLPEKLERQAAILAEHPAAMVYGPTLYWRDWAKTRDHMPANSIGRLGVPADRLYEPPELLKLFLRDPGTVPCTCGLTVRRSVALQVDGFDRRIEHMFEDQVFLAKICAQFPVFVESGCWDKYRQHPDSTSHKAKRSGQYHPRKANPSQEAFLIWLEEYLGSFEALDPQLFAAIDRLWWPYRHPTLYRWRERLRSLPKRVFRTISGIPRETRSTQEL